MALNPQYVLAPSLQEYFVDKVTGLPLAGGTVTAYVDTNRSTLKPVFTLVGGVDTYSYTPLPNPMVLSSVGTIVDGFNNDILPYWLPYDADGAVQLYYIVVKDSLGVPQFTRQAWPNLVAPTGNDEFAYNYARNWQFYSWSNAIIYTDIKTGSIAASATDFVVDDWLYQQNDATQTINITRDSYVRGDNSVPTNSPYYLTYENTGTGSSAGTYNYFSQRFQSAETLQGQNVAVELWLKRDSGIGNISVSLIQNFGTGGISPSASVETFVIPALSPTVSSWQKYTGTVFLPSTTSKTFGTSNNDFLSLNINMPINQVGLIHIGSIRLELGTVINGSQEISNDTMQQETNTFGLYPAFTTGDAKLTVKLVSDPGWLLMNDGTIGKPGSTAGYAAQGAYNLFSMLWTNIHNLAWTPIYTTAGDISTFGATAFADWQALKQLRLTKVLGRALTGAGQSVMTNAVVFSVAGNSVTFPSGIGLSYLTGTPMQFSFAAGGALPATTPQIAINTTYYARNVGNSSAATINLYPTLYGAQQSDGTLITVQSIGTGTQFATTTLSAWPLGGIVGEEKHLQIQGELADHAHVLSSGANGLINVGTAPKYDTGTQNILGLIDRTGPIESFGASGGPSAFNVMQPSSFWNVMIKL